MLDTFLEEIKESACLEKPVPSSKGSTPDAEVVPSSPLVLAPQLLASVMYHGPLDRTK